MGPDFLLLDKPFDHPPADASIVMQVSGSETAERPPASRYLGGLQTRRDCRERERMMVPQKPSRFSGPRQT